MHTVLLLRALPTDRFFDRPCDGSDAAGLSPALLKVFSRRIELNTARVGVMRALRLIESTDAGCGDHGRL
jgi:hypothetical protein